MIRQLLAKLQLRVTLDAGMGDFFVWLVSLPVKIRAREFIAMARIGWAVTHGVRAGAGGAVAAASPMLREGGPAIPDVPAADTAPPAGPSRTAAVAAFGRSFITARPPA